MNQRIRIDDREILVRALASCAEPHNAREVLSFALKQLSADLWVAWSALENIGPNGLPEFGSTIHAISDRAAALEKFVDAHFDVNFKTSGEAAR